MEIFSIKRSLKEEAELEVLDAKARGDLNGNH